MIVYELHNFFVSYMSCHRESLQERKYFGPVLEITASEFTNDKRMTNNMAVIQ
jgi:hypothetical protein